MERIDYIPLGSVVYLKTGIKKILVVARAINVKNGGRQLFFDYGGVLYPEGITGDKMAYFNQNDISSVFFRGCDDEENKNMTDKINLYLEEHPDIIRGSAENWKA